MISREFLTHRAGRVGVKSFEDLKDLNPFFKGFEILLPKKDFGFGIDLNPFVFVQNPSAF